MRLLPEIDALIDANRRELVRRIGRGPGPWPHAWERAWRRHPDLKAIDDALFEEREEASGEIAHEWIRMRRVG